MFKLFKWLFTLTIFLNLAMRLEIWNLLKDQLPVIAYISFIKLPFSVLIIAGLSLACIIWMIDETRKRKKEIASLQQTGQPLLLDPVEVIIDTSQYDYLLYKIRLDWTNPVDKFNYTFLSDSLAYHPGPFIKNKKLTVFINPDDPNRYWVDVTEYKTKPELSLSY